MAEVLDLQEGGEETPNEEKASKVSLRYCRNSYISLALCFVK